MTLAIIRRGPKKLLSICHRIKFCQNAPFRSVTVIFGLPFFFSPWGLRKSSMSSEYSSGSGCRKQAHFTTRSKKPTATSMPPIHKNSNLNDDKPASFLNQKEENFHFQAKESKNISEEIRIICKANCKMGTGSVGPGICIDLKNQDIQCPFWSSPQK